MNSKHCWEINKIFIILPYQMNDIYVYVSQSLKFSTCFSWTEIMKQMLQKLLKKFCWVMSTQYGWCHMQSATPYLWVVHFSLHISTMRFMVHILTCELGWKMSHAWNIFSQVNYISMVLHNNINNIFKNKIYIKKIQFKKVFSNIFP